MALATALQVARWMRLDLLKGCATARGGRALLGSRAGPPTLAEGVAVTDRERDEWRQVAAWAGRFSVDSIPRGASANRL